MSRINLIEDKKIILEDIQIALSFNNWLISIPIANTSTNQEYECLDSEEDDVVLKQ